MTQDELNRAKQLEKDIKEATYKVKAIEEIFSKNVVRVKSDSNINQSYCIPDEFKTVFTAILLGFENKKLEKLEKTLEDI